MPTSGILGWKRSKYWRPILPSSKSPETPRKSFLELIKNTGDGIATGGPHPVHEGGGCAHPPRALPLPRGPPNRPPLPIFCYMRSFTLKKNHKQPFGTRLRRHEAEPRRNLGGTNLGLRQSCSAGDTSLREWAIIAIVITNDPLIERGKSPSTSSPAPSHLQTLVHLLYPILVSKSGIGARRLLVVLITPCS